MFKKYVPPPPITVIKEALSDANSTIPGDIVLDEQGKMLKKYFQYQEVADFLREEYDLWVTKIMPKQILLGKVTLLDGSYIVFENIPPPDKPSRKDPKTGKIIDMMPQDAHELDMSYMAEINADRVHYDKNGVELQRSRTKPFCKIPAMVGSSVCHLSGMSKTQMLKAYQCVTDPLGWFIVEGDDKVILLQEKLRTNQVLIFVLPKGILVAKITCSTLRGSTIIHLIKNAQGSIHINMNFLGKDKLKNTINVLCIFRLLGITKLTDILDYIKRFTKNYNKVQVALAATITEFTMISNDFAEVRLKNPGNKSLQGDNGDATIIKLLKNDLFSHIPIGSDGSVESKLNLLGFMTARYVETIIGLRKIDDRDSWSNKRVVGPARNMERLFSKAFHINMDSIQELINEEKISTFLQVSNKFDDMVTKIQEVFVLSFRGNNWGIKGSYTKENITEHLKRESPLAIYSQLLRINTPISRISKNPNIRMIQGTQLKYVCVTETPEGENCGIVKTMAITARVSMERDDKLIIDIVNKTGNLKPTRDQFFSTMLMVNGRYEGWVNGIEMRKTLLSLRRQGKISSDVCIILDGSESLMIYTNGERLIAPFLIVDEQQQILLMDTKEGKAILNKLEKEKGSYTFHDLIKNGFVEYVDTLEAEFNIITWNKNKLEDKKAMLRSMETNLLEAQDEFSRRFRKEPTDNEERMIYFKSKFNISTQTARLEKMKKQKYTHCDIDPTSILGVAASLIPFLGHNQAPRDVLACAQHKQALSIYHSNQMYRFDKTAKTLAFPTRPLIETQMNSILGFNEMPSGTTGVIAILADKDTQEDGFVFKKEAIDRGFMWYIKYISYSTKVVNTQYYTEEIRKPTPQKGENPVNYSALDEYGIARIGYPVKEGYYLIGKVRKTTTTETDKRTGEIVEKVVEENVSITVGLSDEGIVERVLITHNEVGQVIVKVKIRNIRKPEEGDKFTMRSAGQKGTIGRIESEVNLPFTANGISPDIIINPHSLPSRMTIGMVFEFFGTKAAALLGQRYNATAFRSRKMDELEKVLTEFGFNYNGDETMYSGIKGHELKMQIFIGLGFYQALKHHVRDKIQARSCGKRVNQTMQPNHGRSKIGALRFGEQERDTAISHGASRFLQERLCDVSDAIEVIICLKCGKLSIHDLKQKLTRCLRCKDNSKNFGRARIPNAFKLSMHFLFAWSLDISLISRSKDAVRSTHGEIAGEDDDDEVYLDEEEEEEDEDEE
jgi:DNA-directed RNA polymerase II subunit RPB2